MVLPTETLKASPAIDWVGRKEFDFTCKEVAEGPRPRDHRRAFLQGQRRQNQTQPRARDDPEHGRASVGGGRLQARPADRKIFHRLPAASLRQPVHRPRLPGAMHLLPLAADHRRTQISRPLAAKRRRRNGLHEETLPAGAGIFLRRRHLHREPPARPRDREEARPARRSPGVATAARTSITTRSKVSRTTACACSSSATKAATTKPHAHQERRDHGRDAPLHEGLSQSRRGDSRHVHPRPAGRDEGNHRADHPLRAGTRRVFSCRSPSPRRIPARNFTNWPGSTAGS